MPGSRSRECEIAFPFFPIDLDDADFGDARDLPLFSFLQPGEIGAWPLLMLGLDDEPYTSLEHLIGTLAALQVHSFVDIYVGQDERNSSQYILQVTKALEKV